MIFSFMNSRFDSNACPRTLPGIPCASDQHSQFPGLRPSKPQIETLSRSNHRSPAEKRSTLSLFSLFSHKSENSAPLFSTTYTLFFTLCQRVKRYLHSF